MIRKLYARLWLWTHGYCPNGVAWQYMMGCRVQLACPACGLNAACKQDRKEQKHAEKRVRMLKAL